MKPLHLFNTNYSLYNAVINISRPCITADACNCQACNPFGCRVGVGAGIIPSLPEHSVPITNLFQFQIYRLAIIVIQLLCPCCNLQCFYRFRRDGEIHVFAAVQIIRTCQAHHCRTGADIFAVRHGIWKGIFVCQILYWRKLAKFLVG